MRSDEDRRAILIRSRFKPRSSGEKIPLSSSSGWPDGRRRRSRNHGINRYRQHKRSPSLTDGGASRGSSPTDVAFSVDGSLIETRSLEPGTNEVRLESIQLSGGNHTITLQSHRGQAELKLRVIPGWLSVLPPLLAIVLALWFKDVLLALILGVFSGALILNSWNPLAAFGRTTDYFIRNSLADTDHASILIFTLFLGGMVGVVTKSGGTLGVVSRVSGFATSLRRGQLTTWAMGLLIFFDDYANTLIVGPTMRPITDRLRISREKLAYLVDSTAAPVASLIPISTWVGYEVGLIATALAGLGLELDPYTTFLETIPFRFYPIFALVMVFAVGFFGRDFGPMLHAERRALKDGMVLAEGDVPLSDFSTEGLEPPTGIDPRARNALLPILTVLVVTLLGLYSSGAAGLDPSITGMERFRQILKGADSYSALIWSSASGLFVALILSALQPGLALRDTTNALIEGFKSMLMALTVLILAWSLGAVTSEMHTADFIVGVTEGVLSPVFFPVIVFVVSAAIAFATGTSWATMAILIPLVVPVIHRLAMNAGGRSSDSTHPDSGNHLLSSCRECLGRSLLSDLRHDDPEQHGHRVRPHIPRSYSDALRPRRGSIGDARRRHTYRVWSLALDLPIPRNQRDPTGGSLLGTARGRDSRRPLSCGVSQRIASN